MMQVYFSECVSVRVEIRHFTRNQVIDEQTNHICKFVFICYTSELSNSLKQIQLPISKLISSMKTALTLIISQ